MKILAIDPGPDSSAYVSYDTETKAPVPYGFNKIPNKILLKAIEELEDPVKWPYGDVEYCAIEQVASYGMAVGAEIFETVYSVVRIPRKAVKIHLCGNMKAKDTNIRQAIIDRYGGKDKAIGTKKTGYGVLHGFSADTWSALAVAITAAETVLK
jgi:hypothetical protein